ncbi:MAG TPA: sugar phosphate isomerase/epimerase family protein [Chloroflexota bacterium]
MIRLSAFADEIAPELDEQVAMLDTEGIRWVELRSMWDTNVLDLTDDEIAQIKSRFDAEGIGLSAIGSPLGKVPVDVPLEDELRRLDRAIELAGLFGTPLIRIFSFYPPAGAPETIPSAYRDGVLERLREMAARARASGITLVHENDTDLYGDTKERCLDVLQSVDSPALQQAFDPANFIVSGDVPYPDAYDALHPWVRHVHVKDARPDRTVVIVGEGVGRWPELLQRLRSDGYAGFFTLEPHLAQAGQYQGFSGRDRFREASQAFQRVLHETGWDYA